MSFPHFDEFRASIRGVWDAAILASLASGISRPADLITAINAQADRKLTHKVLIESLRRMEESGLVRRQELSRRPRRTCYWPTAFGYMLLRELDKLDSWYAATERYRADASRPHSEVSDVTPHVARIYDHYLGGTNNTAADRQAAEQIYAVIPVAEAGYAVRENRAFVQRAVRLAAEAGVRQFIDIGTGLPAAGNVHEIVHQVAPGSSVVCVDHDPLVVAPGLAPPEGTRQAAMIEADLRRPEEILDNSLLCSRIDFGRPVAVVLAAVLHFIMDEEDPYQIVGRLRDAMAPGSYLVISHGSDEGMERDITRRAVEVYRQSGSPIVSRDRPAVRRFLDGFEILAPGVVFVPGWRPGAGGDTRDPGQSHMLGAVGRLP